MPELEVEKTIRDEILQDIKKDVVSCPSKDEVTVRMVATEHDISMTVARNILNAKVKSGEYYVRKNGLSPDKTGNCNVYGKK